MTTFLLQKTLIIFLLFLMNLFTGSRANNGTSSLPPAAGFIPVDPTVYQVGDSGMRRKLVPFQLCLVCKCCAAGSPASNCSMMNCCFGIDCQLPDKPFGVCAFVPKFCSCDTCSDT